MNTTVTRKEVLANMQNVFCRTVMEFGKPTTYVTVRMLNGYTLRESTTCVDPSMYDEEQGKNICLKKIEDKVWFLLGYALQEKLHSPKSPSNESEKEEMVSIPKGKYDILVRRSECLKSIEQTLESERIKMLDVWRKSLAKTPDPKEEEKLLRFLFSILHQ